MPGSNSEWAESKSGPNQRVGRSDHVSTQSDHVLSRSLHDWNEPVLIV